MIECKKVSPEMSESLFIYFSQLSVETKSYFAPHPFDFDTVRSICSNNYNYYTAYVCLHEEYIIAYAVLKNSLSEGEINRFSSYSIQLNFEKDYIFAPSVADAYQSKGIGNLLFRFIEADLKSKGAEKIILWGGVQLRNEKAIKFYLKNGFKTVGKFWYDGLDNLDMLKDLQD